MASRSKQTLALEKLKDIGKATLKIPSASWYLNDDIAVVVAGHQNFFVAVAPHTKRLNPASLSLMGKDLFQMANRESKLFGESLSHAYSHCMQAGSKAQTGEKLAKEIWAVYQASCADGGGVKQEATKATVKTESCSPPPKKSLKMCLSSPSQIAALYAGSSSSAAVKVISLCI